MFQKLELLEHRMFAFFALESRPCDKPAPMGGSIRQNQFVHHVLVNGQYRTIAAGRHVYELKKLRCNACGTVFNREEPEGVKPEKYDETVSTQLTCGSGVPFPLLGEDGRAARYSAAGGHAMGTGRGDRGSDQTGTRGTDPSGSAGKCCTTTLPACGCSSWSETPPMSERGCSRTGPSRPQPAEESRRSSPAVNIGEEPSRCGAAATAGSQGAGPDVVLCRATRETIARLVGVPSKT